MVTPPKINTDPIAMYQERAPEKYCGKNKESTKAKNTDQNEYVTFKQSPFVAPILSIAVYQHRNDIIPIRAVIARSIQHGVYEKIAAIPIPAFTNPPPKIGDTISTYTVAEVK